MKDETAKRPFVPLPRERAIHASPPRLSLSLKSPKPASSSASIPLSSETVDHTSSSGTAYITSQRLVYLPATPTPTLQSFSVPLLHLHDTYVTAPWFGPNVMMGQVQPVPMGGLPTPAAAPYLLELKLTFNEGGAYDFHAKFAEVRERLVQNREMVREIGGNAGVQEAHGEQLPAYEKSAASSNGVVGTDSVQGSGSGADQDRPPSFEQASTSSHANISAARRDYATPPDEPPPGYDEIQHST